MTGHMMGGYDVARLADDGDWTATRRYPTMPDDGWCRYAANFLCMLYPELRLAEGNRLLALHSSEGRMSSTIAHAWNMTADRRIVDSTLPAWLRRVLVDRTAIADGWTIEVTYAGRCLSGAELDEHLAEYVGLREKIQATLATGRSRAEVAARLMQLARESYDGDDDKLDWGIKYQSAAR